jgi:hypothetical protein
MSPPFPAATVSRSRVGASRAPAAPLRGRFATLDPPTRSQDPAAIREQADERQRILTKDRTGARSRYAKSPRFQGNPGWPCSARASRVTCTAKRWTLWLP